MVSKTPYSLKTGKTTEATWYGWKPELHLVTNKAFSHKNDDYEEMKKKKMVKEC